MDDVRHLVAKVTETQAVRQEVLVSPFAVIRYLLHLTNVCLLGPMCIWIYMKK